ncbi:penicillin-binding protein [Salsuginibacillus kocurii]|uniref:penicillin-binding protein n=1 Tax=Salsuginibacillus kocurii TaxID=427078 RepID=UPI00036408F7|nr:penicillin-binding protein [Salsuginibacillus kocurii]
MNENKKRGTVITRALFILTIIFIFLAVFSGRLIYVQVGKEVDGQNLEAIAESRWTTEEEIAGSRGTIYDRHGDPIAEEVQSYSVYAVLHPDADEAVEDPDKTASELAAHIDMEEEDLRDLIGRGIEEERYQVELGAGSRFLSYEEKEEIEALELEGIFFRDETKRYYPNQEFASHVLGYVDRNTGTAGMGLEAGLNEELTGEPGSVSYKRDGRGLPLLDPDETIQEPVEGNEVTLTLDSTIQTSLEQAMSQVEKEYDPERMTAIVADPETGAILGMTNRPSFDPNEYNSIENYSNYAVSESIEPGSTMKMFTLAAAIEEGVYNGEDTFQSGRYSIGPDTVSDHNQGEGWGEITYDEGFERSSNVAFAKMVKEHLGSEQFYNYLEDFGFNEPTGIDLPREATSSIARQYEFDTAATAFGQASAFTPIQMVQAATAIANDGTMVQPYVVENMYDASDESVLYERSVEEAGTPISAETAQHTRDLLEDVVTSSNGTGTPYHIEGFDVIGKTGTAQIVGPEGGYLQGDDENIFSFLGMAPKDDPQLITYVAVDRPNLDEQESGTAPVSKIFNTVMQQSLQYLDVTPDFEEEASHERSGTAVEDVTGMSIEEAANTLEDQGLEPLVLHDEGEVVNQVPKAGSSLIHGEKVILAGPAEEPGEMPDLTGWTLRDVAKIGEVLDLSVHHLGNGFVTAQSIETGANLNSKEYLTVELAERDFEEEVEESDEDAETEDDEGQAEDELHEEHPDVNDSE